MSDESPLAVGVLLLGEVLLHVAIAALIAGSFTGHTSTLASASPVLRALLLLALGASGIAPLWVFRDVRRADDELIWVHVVLLPLVNLFGVAAYLAHRSTRSTG